ncbi:hypothetical protein ACLB1E_22400 [Escherichia coli]
MTGAINNIIVLKNCAISVRLWRARSEEMANDHPRNRQTNQPGAEVAKVNLCDWYAVDGPAMRRRNLRWWKISRQLLSIHRWGRSWRLCRGIFRYGR